MSDKLKNLDERKEELVKRIELAEKGKKKVIGISQGLLVQHKKRKISKDEYGDKLKEVLNGRNIQEWLDYYDNYIAFCNKYLDSCRRDIRKERGKLSVRKTVPFLIIFGVLILLILLFTFFISIQIPVFLAPPEVIPEVLPEISEVTKIEQEIPRGKRVIVTGPPAGLENVPISTEIPEIVKVGQEKRIRVYWHEENKFIDFEVTDLDGNGFLDSVSWIIPYLGSEEQTFDIIVIIGAEHLDSSRTFIRDIFKEVSEIDSITYTIPNNEYVRAYFERNLTNENVIDIFVIDSAGTILVYEKDSDVVIGKVEDVTDGVYFIELNHTGYQSIFDMKSIRGDITYDFIHDAPAGHLEDDFITCSPGTIEVGERTNCTGQYDDTTSGTGDWKLWLMDDGINITRSSGSSNFIVTNVFFVPPCDSESDGIVTCDGWSPNDDNIPIIWELEAISADIPNEILTNASASTSEDITLNELGFVNITEAAIDIEGCGIMFGGTQSLDIENATYHLLNDVTDENFNDISICFDVSAKNITLDGLGHYVFALQGAQIGVFLDDLAKNFIIKNINITGFDIGIDGAGSGFGPVTHDQPIIIINSTLEELVDINGNLFTGGSAIIINSTIGSIDAHGNLCPSDHIGGCDGTTQNNLDIIYSNITTEILTYGGFGGSGGNITMVSDFIYMNNLIINAAGYDDMIVDNPPGTLTINYTNGFTDIDTSYSEKINLRIVNRSNAGEIAWISDTNTGAINSSSLTNLSIHTEIHHNFAFVNGTALPDLDMTSLISLYGSPALGFTNPIILKDGLPCPETECVLLTPIGAETVIFNVTGFSNYSIGGDVSDAVPPLIAFVPPTPDDASVQSNTDIYVNVSSSDENDHYTFVDFDNDVFLWMRMDDTNSSGDPTDLSSYSNNGTLNGDAFINSTGYFGSASHFDGINDATDDYIQIVGTDGGDVRFNSSFSVSLWVRQVSQDFTRDMIGIDSSSCSSAVNEAHRGWVVRVNTAERVQFCYHNGTTRAFANGPGSNRLDSGVWRHVVAVYDSSTPSLQVYHDAVAGIPATGVPTSGGANPARNLRIGMSDRFNRIWNGTIDEVILFNRSLTATEVAALYNASANQYFNNFTGLADGTYNFTGYAVDIVGNKNQTEERSVTISSPPANNPVIVDISDIGFVNIIPGDVKYITFSVLVSDPNGFLDIDTVNASFSPPFELITRHNSSCIFVNIINPFTANYSCSVDIWYFDEPGQWNVTVTANDSQNLQSDYYFENFVLGETVIFVQYPLGPDGFTWPPLIPGSQDILANEIMLINNTGNANVSLGGIHINATNLIGQADNNYFIPAENFSINTINFCGGTPMSNGENVTIPDALLPRGNNSINNLDETSGQEVLYICIEQVPTGLLDQDYGPAPWDINFNALIAGLLATIFAVPLAIARAKKRKKKNQKELIKALSDEDLLEILGEKLVEFLDVVKGNKLKIKEKEEQSGIPVSIFRDNMSPAEALCKFMKENLGMNYSEIAKVINRDQRTLWTNYNNAIKKKKDKIVIGKEKIISIPIKVFWDRKFSILESIVKYLKEQGFRNSEVASILGKDSKNIWTLYSRVKKKLGIKTKS